MKYLKLIFILSLIFSLNASAANEDGNKLVNVQYYFEKNIIHSNDSIRVIAEITPETDWHIYWINPGDAGLATNLEFTLQKGFTTSEIKWAYPEIQKSEGIINFGYSKKVNLLFTIYSPQQIDQNNLFFKSKVSWLVCKEKCIPGSKTDSISFGSLKIISNWNDLYQNSLNKIPKLAFNNYFEAIKDSQKVVLRWDKSISLPNSLNIFPIDEGIYEYKEKYISYSDEKYNYINLDLSKLRASEPDNLHIIIIPEVGFPAEDDKTAIEIKVNFKN